MKRLLVLLLVTCASATALAIDTDKRFDDPELQARYEALISEVRCLQCQNQSIKDSNVSLAADLRREIARMIDEGQTDEEIAEFLVTQNPVSMDYSVSACPVWRIRTVSGGHAPGLARDA